MSKATTALNANKWSAWDRILQAKGDDLRKLIAHQREEMAVERDPDDEGAAAQWSVDRDLAMINLNRAILTLSEVDAALQSIEEGEYGMCRRCGEPISDVRLSALPWTRLCLECARG